MNGLIGHTQLVVQTKTPVKKKINKFSTVVTPDPFLTLHPGS